MKVTSREELCFAAGIIRAAQLCAGEAVKGMLDIADSSIGRVLEADGDAEARDERGRDAFNRKFFEKKMESRRLSILDIARSTGVSGGTIAHILTGRKQPSLALTVDIAKALGCTVDELVVKEAG